MEGKGSINASMQKGLGALQVAKATYDFAVDGGAVGTITPINSPVFPAGAIIMGGVIYPITLPTSGGAATIGIGFGSGAQAALIKAAATGIATYVAGVPLVMIPVWASGFFKVAVEGKMTFTVGTAALTAGKIAVHVAYFMDAE